MSAVPRYAIYYVPEPEAALYRFGAAWLGYDLYRGEPALPPGALAGIADWAAIIRAPRVYGFHATLKAPFPLADGAAESDLLEAARAFAALPRPIPRIVPVVRTIERFVAVVPASHGAELEQLAADCVRTFDRFRAPLTDDERSRRDPAALSPRQRDHLDRWGYPYVMDDFRFHMTLTGALDTPRCQAMVELLQPAFAALRLDALAIDRIVILRQDGASQSFRSLAEFQLTEPN